MGVSKNNGTPQIINFNRAFQYKPSILGTPIFGNIHIYNSFLSVLTIMILLPDMHDFCVMIVIPYQYAE